MTAANETITMSKIFKTFKSLFILNTPLINNATALGYARAGVETRPYGKACFVGGGFHAAPLKLSTCVILRLYCENIIA
jgi:hypothetical protein